MVKNVSSEELLRQNKELEARLEELEETLRAVRSGEVDALVVSTSVGDRVFTLEGADQSYRILIEGMTEGAALLSDRGTVLYCNKGFSNVVKQSIEGIVGSNILEIVVPSDAHLFKEFLAKGREDEDAKQGEITLQLKDGTLLPTLMSVTKLEKDGVKTTCLIVTDLTQHMEKEIKNYTEELENEIVKRKKAEQALMLAKEQSEQDRKRLETILETFPAAVVIVEVDGRFSYQNSRAMQLYGVNYVGFDLSAHVAKVRALKPDNTPFPLDEMPVSHSLRFGREIRNVEMMIERADEKRIPVLVSSTPLFDVNGKISSAIVIFDDITESKKAEEALRESEERLRLAQSAGNVGIWDWNVCTGEVHWSPELERIYGLEPGSVPRYEGFRRRVYHEDLAMLETSRDEAVAQHRGFGVEFRVLQPNGKLVWIYSRGGATYDEAGNTIRVFGVAIDITERKKAEEKLNALKDELEDKVKVRTKELAVERKRFYDMLDNLPVMVCLLTRDYKVAFSNRKFREKFGEPEGRHCYEFVACENQPCESCESFLPLETGEPHHWIAKFSDGTVCEAFDFPFTDVDGSRMILEADVDITERVNLEKQLRDAERLAVIGTTAGMVGHDIRNPLQAIVGDLYLANSDLAAVPECEAKEGLEESLEEIEKNIEYIDKIVQDLQDFAKPIKPSAKETDVETLCQEVLFKDGIPENVGASCEVEENAKMMIIDPDLLKRILSNLVSNAVQAMPEGGKLEVRAFQEESETVISVQDTGVGIPEEIRPKLFVPLFTTKSKGQGFGLAVVKRITEALGGTVTFESKVGRGTKFIVRLPSAKKANNH
jgi:PAS domain S-box-containing protein